MAQQHLLDPPPPCNGSSFTVRLARLPCGTPSSPMKVPFISFSLPISVFLGVEAVCRIASQPTILNHNTLIHHRNLRGFPCSHTCSILQAQYQRLGPGVQATIQTEGSNIITTMIFRSFILPIGSQGLFFASFFGGPGTLLGCSVRLVSKSANWGTTPLWSQTLQHLAAFGVRGTIQPPLFAGVSFSKLGPKAILSMAHFLSS